MTPRVTVLLLTYDRFDYALKTLTCLRTYLRYSGPLRLHIADDGSPAGYIDSLAGHVCDWWQTTTSNSERGGYGANYNLALQTVHLWSDVVLPLEDDWELTRTLDLDPLVEALDELDCIRLGYVGYTQALRGRFEYISRQHYLVLDPDSEERHVFAGHPRLETVRFERLVGPWPEGIDPGTTEFEVSGREAARHGVAWPMDLVHPRGDLFAHIGTIQARTDQREASAVA